MNHFHTHNTSAMKDVQSMEAVSMPLNEGIVSICNICKFLKKAHICPITDTVSNYNQIRKHVEDAEQHLKTSDTIVTEKLRYLNERMEHLIIEKLIVEREIKEKIQAVNTLSTKKSSAEQSLGCFQAALEQAKRNVESKNDAIRRCQEQMSTNDDIVTAGTALLAVPILGWIAGPIMMSSGQQAYEEALNALRNAESDRQNCMSQVRNWEKKVDHYDTVISRTTNEIWQTNQAIKRNESRMEEIKMHHMATGQIQEMVSKVVFHLNALSGRVSVLERQTKSFILWKPVVNIMENVMNAVECLAKNRLLYSDGAPGLINTLRENVGGLLAICNKPSDSENDSYNYY